MTLKHYNLRDKSLLLLVCLQSNKSTAEKLKEVRRCLEQRADVNTRDGHGDTPLHLAVRCERAVVVKLLLKRGADVNARNFDGNTPLYDAVQYREKNIVELLIKEGAYVNTRDRFGDTPLHKAARFGRTSIGALLLKKGADANAQDESGDTPLHEAAQSGEISMVNLLLDNGAHINEQAVDGYTPLHGAACSGKTYMVKLLLNKCAKMTRQISNRCSLLHLAAFFGETSMVELLLDNGADVNEQTINGYTALHAASKSGNMSMVEFLLNKGAKVNAQTTYGYTALNEAARSGVTSVLKMLLNKSTAETEEVTNGHPISQEITQTKIMLVKEITIVNLQTTDGYTLLHGAVESKELSIVNFLLEKGANVNSQTIDGYAPLHIAANSGETFIVELLLVKGAYINAQVTKGDTPLHMAVRLGGTSLVELLLNKEADVNLQATNGYTPLHAAARSGNSSIVLMLLKKGAKVNANTNDGYTPLHAAVRSGQASVVEILLNNGAYVNKQNLNGESPLHGAVRSEIICMVEMLLNKEAKVNVKAVDGYTPLHAAALSGKKSLVELLLKSGSNVNEPTTDGVMPLVEAVRSRKTSVVQLLLKNGAIVNVHNAAGFTPLIEAAFYGETPIMKLLLKRGATVNVASKNKTTPLHYAAYSKETAAVELLLNNGANINAQTTNGETPLYMAIRSGKGSVVRLLLKNGANVNTQTMYKNTPLHESMNSGELFIVKLLLNNGADPNSQAQNGCTPLHIAACTGRISLVTLLLSKGVDVNVQSRNGYTALFSAAGSTDVSVVKLLLSQGADVNAQAADGYTPLHKAAAARCGAPPIVELFLSKGVNMNAQTTNGYTPLHEAAFYGETSTVKLLVERGSDVNAIAWNAITPLHQAINSGILSKVEVLLNNGANVNAQKTDGDTPLHLALRKENTAIATLLVHRGANVILRNRMGDTPLSYALLFSRKDNTDIVNLLQNAETSISKYDILESRGSYCDIHDIFQSSGGNDNITNDTLDNGQHKYLKMKDTSGVSGQLYETKMMSLIFLRVLNHEQIEYDFLLGANVNNIGAMDDICLRYRVRGQKQTVVLFIQAKHREDPEKGKLSDEALWNDSGDFCLRKYFQSYLMIKDRFQIGNKDPMFEGEFSDVECYFILFTSAKDIISKKTTDNKVNKIMHDLINTVSNTEPFQFNYDEVDIDRLIDIQTEVPIKKTEASDFLTRFWFYSNQSRQDEVEDIVKDEIRKYCYNDRTVNHFEVHSNAVFLKAHDELQKWWMQAGVARYLSRSNDFFKRAKLACLEGVFLTILNAMTNLKIKVDLELKQNYKQNNVTIGTISPFNEIICRLLKIFEAEDKITVAPNFGNDIKNHLMAIDSITSPTCHDQSLGSIYNSNNLDDTSNAYNNSNCEFFKRAGTSGIRGALFRIKLLSLILFRMLNHEHIEQDHLLATKIRGINLLNDICIRFRINGEKRPIMLFVQLIHREDPKKGKLSAEEVWSDSGSQSLPLLFASYLEIKNRFQVNNKDPMFLGEYPEIDSYFFLYTSAKESFTKKKTENQVIKVVQDIIGTTLNVEPFQYDYSEADLEHLSKLTVIDRIQRLGVVFLKYIMVKKYSPNLLSDKFIATYHVPLGREVLRHCETQPALEKYRMWEFRPDFFESNLPYLVTLKQTFVKLLSQECDQNQITNGSQNLDIAQKKLMSLKIKLPLAFGNLDMTFRGNETNVRNRVKVLAEKLMFLLELNIDTKIVEINDKDVGPGKTIEQGIIKINGGIGSAVGNVLILDTESKLLKLDLEHKDIPNLAALFVNELKDKKYNKTKNYFNHYRFKINISGFPKYSFYEDECDKSKAKDFFSKFWFYPEQATEDEVERILNYELDKIYTDNIHHTKQRYKKSSDLIMLHSLNEIQKWWMQTSESPYLSQASKLFEHAELADICNLLQTVINYMYISSIDRLDIKVKRYKIDEKFERIQQVFRKVSSNLFSLFDPKFNKPFDFRLQHMRSKMFDSSMLSLRIHPDMEWVALVLIAGSGTKIYSVVAKAGPGTGGRNAKDSFMITEQTFNGQFCTTRDCLENIVLYDYESGPSKLKI